MEHLRRTFIFESSAGRTKRIARKMFKRKMPSGMIFLIVIVLFAIFGFITLSDILMIDDNDDNDTRAIPWGEILSPSIERTLPPYPVNATPTDGSWEVVNGTASKFFVFSAFYDGRPGEKLIRVIGATKTKDPEKVWCRLWYPIGLNNLTFESSSVIGNVKSTVLKYPTLSALLAKFVRHQEIFYCCVTLIKTVD